MKQFITKKTKCLNVCRIFLVMAVAVLFGTVYSSSHADAASAYQIRINKQANCVTVYKQNSNGTYKPVKAIICSTGYATKLGTYSLGQKMRWHTLMGPCYGQYCTRIYGGVLFHSVWYTSQNPSTLSISSYNKLGITASHGCVRLTVADAKWIYNNVPSGSKVIIYSSKNPGPLGKPKAIKLPGGIAWDPTDTDNPSNPWNKKKPSITGVKNIKLNYGAPYKVMKGVKAKNTTGFDAKKLLKVTIRYNGNKVSKVNTKKPGTYRVTYKLVDEISRKAAKRIRVKVLAAKKTPVLSVPTEIYITSKKSLNKKSLLSYASAKQAGKKLASKYISVKWKKLKTNVYRVTYTAQNASDAAIVKTKLYIDNSAPVIEGVTNGSVIRVAKNAIINKEYAKSLIKSVKDNYTKLTINSVVTTITKKNNEYVITYQTTDKAGNTTIVKVTVIPTDFVTINGSDSVTVNSSVLGVDANASSEVVIEKVKAYLLSGTAYNAVTYQNKDITSSMTAVVTKQAETTYQAALTAKDSEGHFVTKNVIVNVNLNN